MSTQQSNTMIKTVLFVVDRALDVLTLYFALHVLVIAAFVTFQILLVYAHVFLATTSYLVDFLRTARP